jgi:hypothetical protein
MSQNISCPVSHVTVNEYRVRIVASLVFVLSIVYLFLPDWIIPAFLAIDFFIRGFRQAKFSPLSILSGWIVNTIGIGNRPIDQAPKRFAAQLGFVFSSLLLTFTLFSLPEPGYVTAGILTLFSFLESALGFCAGCQVYTLIRKFFPSAHARR